MGYYPLFVFAFRPHPVAGREDELGISIKIVEKHRQHLMDTLGIPRYRGLTRYAIAAGVIESSVQRTT